MNDNKGLCAIIISYNGNKTIVNCIENVRKEVDCVLVIDNGSSVLTKNTLEGIQMQYSNVVVLYLEENMGVAYALNCGLKYAKEKGYHWIITFDQDTIPQHGSITNLVEHAKYYNKVSDKNVSFGPQLALTFDKEMMDRKARRGVRRVTYLITSGNLTLVEAASRVGGWTDELFIDAVDYDFSLKLRSEGYKLRRCYDCIMAHELGETDELGNKNVHNNMRKYYMIRNYKYIMRTYFFKFPGYCSFLSIFFIKGILSWMKTEDRKQLKELVTRALKATISEKY